jgi:hypothetical protein
MVMRTTVQCYYVDEEMFVGDQRFAEDVTNEFIDFWRPPKYGDEEKPDIKRMDIRAGEEMVDQEVHIEVMVEEEEFGKLTPPSSQDSDDADDKFLEARPEYREDNDEFL